MFKLIEKIFIRGFWESLLAIFISEQFESFEVFTVLTDHIPIGISNLDG